MLSNNYVTIRDVSQQTGVAAVTLRAWERRYGLVRPKRTPKGHRLYSLKNIEQIQTIVSWLNRGVAISKVAELLASNDVPANNSIDDKPWQDMQVQLLNALTELKQNSLNPLLDKLNKSVPFVTLCEQVYQPLHHTLITRWYNKPLGYQLEQQLWQQCWQRQITIMTLRAEKQKSHALAWLVNLDDDAHTLDYWLLYSLLIQSGIRIHTFNHINDLSELSRLQDSKHQALILFGDSKINTQSLEQLTRISDFWKSRLFVLGHISRIHKEVITNLPLNHIVGYVSQCWQSEDYQSWLKRLGESE